MAKKTPLFKHKPLPWNNSTQKSSINEELKYKISDTDYIYETAWVIPKSKPISLQAKQKDILYLSTKELTFIKEAVGQKYIIKAKEELLPVLDKCRWSEIVVIGQNRLEDVVLGLWLLQSLDESKISDIEQVVFVTSSGSEDDMGLWGLARTSRFEYPNLNIRCLECEQNNFTKAMSAIEKFPKENELSVDADGQVRVQRLQKVSLQTSDVISINSEATYVISGGLGGLGILVTKDLVEQGAKYLLLLTRSKDKVEDLPEEIRILQEKANICCFVCDVSKHESVLSASRWLEESAWPKVAGIIHAAGVLTDGTIPNQTAENFKITHATKVKGAKNLRNILKSTDFMILFSSAAATFGLAAQASYTAADTAVDALANNWSRQGENVLSIQWGAWSESGMAVRLNAVKRAEVDGFGSITDQLGINVLNQLIAAKRTGVVCVSPIDWDTLFLNRPILSELRKQSAGAIGKSRSITELLVIVRQAVHDAIGMNIADDVPLLENGLDSLASVSLRNRIAKSLQIELPSDFILDAPDISAMVRYLMAKTLRSTVSSAKTQVLKSDLPILIIGTGMGGLSFARELEKMDIPIVVMDKSDEIGGVWHSLANTYSKLQIDSPSYDFDSTNLPTEGDHRWDATYPNQAEIMAGCQQIVDSLKGPVHLKTFVKKVVKLADMEYEVQYEQDGKEYKMNVSGVAAMVGGLHRPRLHTFPRENEFEGFKSLGVSNDTSSDIFKDASVLIVGHGAFAVENMRTALEHGAKHITILCRQQNIVFSTFCTYLLNSSKGTMSTNDLIDVVRPFYEACGIDVETLPSLMRNENGELILDQPTLPPSSDLYFLAQLLGKLTVIVDEIDHFDKDGVVTKNNKSIKADIVIKCLGSHRDKSVLNDIFGEDSKITGIWINDDPNLFTYNDGAQVPRNIKSLVCGSYAFFIQAFVPAYLYFRHDRAEFDRALERVNSDSAATSNIERVIYELWNFVEPAKRIVSERTLELCPFDRFQVEREKEWQYYLDMLDADNKQVESMWELLDAALITMHRRNPSAPVEQRSIHPVHGDVSVFIPRHRRVLFLPGQGTNGRLARALLERTGWISRSSLEFVIPDAPYEMPAFTNEEQLGRIGLDGLVDIGLYDKSARYREWKAGFEDLWENHEEGKPIVITSIAREQWNTTLTYLKELIRKYGPFDGIAGFCEGAAVASVALHLQERGEDSGLGSIRFFIAMSPWRSPMHELDGLYSSGESLQLPMLQTVGNNDMKVFLVAAPKFKQDFYNADEYRHEGQHVYPTLTPTLERKLRELLNRSEKKQNSETRVMGKKYGMKKKTCNCLI